MSSKGFIALRGDYRNLASYQVADCLYAITHHFAHRFLSIGDRTVDQMVQAARSAKQNIAEGSVDGATSTEMEIKLMNVARGSMHELRADYEDYLTHHQLERWARDDSRTAAVRAFSKKHNKPADYLDRLSERSDETIANIALTLIHQYDYLMERLIKSIERRFLEQGGIKEQMYKARLEQRDRQREAQSPQSPQSSQSSQSSQSPRSSQSPQSSQSSQSSRSPQSPRSSQSSQSPQSPQSPQSSRSSLPGNKPNDIIN